MKKQSMITEQKVNPAKVKFSKRLRSHMTKSEEILWQRLRRSQVEGVHFRRQQVLFGFIADFYSHSKRLVIEVDGKIHNERVKEDKKRETVFLDNGITVIRFKNEEVETQIDKVLQKISETISETNT